MVWNYVQNKALELFTRIIKIKYSKTEERMSWIFLIPFFFRRFSWTLYFVRHFSYPLRKASKICPAIPRQFSRYSSDGQVDSKILARYWTLSVHHNTLLCFPFTRDGRFLFQLFHLPMRFDCRKISVLERDGGGGGGRTCDMSAILLPFREIGLILSERFVFPSYAPFLLP